MDDDLERKQVSQILQGDSKAFRNFVDSYQRLVAHIVFRMVPEADREDICQDVFVKAYQNLKSFHFQSKLSTWLARITYNTCVNYLEKKRVPLFDNQSKENQSLNHWPAEETSPYHEAEKKDTFSHLRDEIEKLPVIYRTIITLYHLDQMSYAEIGKITALPEGTVKSYLFRARKMLRRSLLTHYQEEELC